MIYLFLDSPIGDRPYLARREGKGLYNIVLDRLAFTTEEEPTAGTLAPEQRPYTIGISRYDGGLELLVAKNEGKFTIKLANKTKSGWKPRPKFSRYENAFPNLNWTD